MAGIYAAGLGSRVLLAQNYPVSQCAKLQFK